MTSEHLLNFAFLQGALQVAFPVDNSFPEDTQSK